MVSRIGLCFLLGLLSAPAFAMDAGCEQTQRSDDERYTELQAVKNEFDPARGSVDDLDDEIAGHFRSLWCDSEYGAGLEQAEDAVVSLRLRAARTVSFYARPDWVLERLRAVVEEAHDRGLVDSGELRNLFTAYQAAGRYEAAREIRANYPGAGLPEVPQVVPPPDGAPGNARLIWRVDGEANRLQGEWLAMDGPQLLVVTSPGCNFCKAAAEDLTTDEVLSPLMRRHAHWLAGPTMNNTFHSVVHWNEHRPLVPTMLVDDPDDWPVSNFGSTPQFLFLRDGEVIHTLVGWHGGPEALEAIADGFDRLGLLDASQLPDDAFAYAQKLAQTRGCPERAEALEKMRQRAPIMTREALERHLARIEAGADSPLTEFTTEGRKRFVSNMRFRDDGSLMGFGYGELKAQLEPHEIYEVTALFGQQYFYAGRLFEVDMLSEAERELKAMFECEV